MKKLTKNMITSIMLLLISVSNIPAQDIFTAARTGNLETVKLLVEKNNELIKIKDQNGTTPLHFACSGKHLEVQKYLIEKGADVNAQEIDLSAPLHYAVFRNHTEGVELLIVKGANVNALDSKKHTPLHLASQNGMKDIVTVLVKNGAQLELKDDYGRTPLVLGSRERGGPEVIKILLEAGADVNSIDNSKFNALTLAAWRGNKEVVEILLNFKAKLPEDSNVLNELVSSSVQKGILRLFKIVIDTGFDVKKLPILLNDAASGGSKEMIQILIDQGLKINDKDINGWTPLHYAAWNGREEAVQMILQNGGDVNVRNLAGQTAYNIAEWKGNEKLKQILVSMNAEQSPTQFPVLKGDYLGQTLPGKTPKLFARGIVSSIWGLHSSPVFSPDGNEVYWRPMIVKPDAAYTTGGPFMMKRINGVWTSPQQPAPFNADITDDVPFFSPDGTKLFLLSNRPLPGEQQARKENIWVMEKTESGWSEMRPFDQNVNSQEMHWQFSIDKKGNVYFGSSTGSGMGVMDIYCAKFEKGKYNKPVNLGAKINSDKLEMTPFIAPDGSYLLFQRAGDIFVSFLKKDGSWCEAINMGASVNSPAGELCPIVTPDGKYLFFLSTRYGDNNAFWVDASVIEELKPKDL